MSKRKTAEQMYPLVAEWETTGQTREEFCSAHGLTLSSFAYWRQKYLEGQNQPDTGFKELLPTPGAQIEVCYPNGVKVTLPANGSMATIRALIHLV